MSGLGWGGGVGGGGVKGVVCISGQPTVPLCEYGINE